MRWTDLVIAASAVACRSSTPARGPEIDVMVSAPRLAAAEIETSIATPVEDAVSRVSHVARIRSRSADGFAMLQIDLESGADSDAGTSEVQRAIAGVIRQLPMGVEPPTVAKAGGAVVARYLMLSNALTRVEVTRALDELVRKLEETDGVGHIELCGDSQARVEIDVDSMRLEAAGLDIPAVVAVVRTVRGSVETMRGTSVGHAQTGDSTFDVRLADIADVRDGVRDSTCRAYYRGRRAVEAIVRAQPGADVARVRDAIAEVIAAARRTIPASVELVAAPDATPIEIGVSPTATNIETRIRRELAEVVEVRSSGPCLVIPTPDARIDDPRALVRGADGIDGVGTSDATLELLGPDLAALQMRATAMAAAVHPIARIGFDGVPKRYYEIDRDAAAKAGVSVNAIETTLAAVDGIELGRGPSEPVVLRVRTADDRALADVAVHAASGTSVPLSSLVRVVVRPQLEIFHVNRQRMVGFRMRAVDVPELPAPPPGIQVQLVRD